jgi:6,7-dimethyl-8-ribityllumazine synthase
VKIKRKGLRRFWRSERRCLKGSKVGGFNTGDTEEHRVIRSAATKDGLKIERFPEEAIPAIEGGLSAAGRRFGVVVSRFNSFITERLFLSAVDGLVRSGARRKDIDLVRVPGAFEIPLAARKLAETGKYDAIICLGCLLRGDTAHYDVIVNEVTRGIGQSAQETGVPHAFGVLTCENLEQAIDRAGLKMGNKGFEAALAAVEMASLTAAEGLQAAGSGKTTPRERDKMRSKKKFARNVSSKKRGK